MASAGLFNHTMTATQALMGKSLTPMDTSTNGTNGTNGTTGSSDADSGSATISANDFLTLLVTEMQNQDPTADTDPNEYINQLVEVNSLEQLIDINQTLTTDLGGSSASSGNGTSAQAQEVPSVTGSAGAAGTPIAQHVSARSQRAPAMLPAGVTLDSATDVQNLSTRRAPGNLSIPGAIPAAQRVARALDGRVQAQPGASILSVAH